MSEFIEQIIAEILASAEKLSPARRRKFLTWLGDHTSRVGCAGKAGSADYLAREMAAWLGSLTVPGILWEYRLILGEIEWWSAWEGDLEN